MKIFSPAGATALFSTALALGAALLPACSRKPEPRSAASAPAPVPVTAAAALSVDLPVTMRAIGTVGSKARVTLRPQITARVLELLAEEGRDVRAGQPLLRLDARPFESELREAEANLAQARAMADDARRLAARLEDATDSLAVSNRELEETRAKVVAADAGVLSEQAKVELARLNIEYCTIAAPFAGRLGQVLVRPGTILKANESDLVELTQIDPIEIGFAVPEAAIAAIRAASAAGPVRVEASPGGDTGAPQLGAMSFLDNKVDPTTGTIQIKATFPNASLRLWPGQFANVTLVLGREPGSIAIPESAVQPSQNGPIVFVIRSDQSVELRPVVVRRTVDGQSLIDHGLAQGETVVTDGHLRLTPGAKVQIKTPPAPRAAATAGDAR